MDTLMRAINAPETIRVVAAITTDSVREACRRQGATHISAIVLGRAMTIGALLATLGKGDEERVRVQISGGGALGQIDIDAHGDGRMRACVRHVLEPKHLANRMLDEQPRPRTAIAVGTRGHLVVTRDLGLSKPYQGSTTLISGELDEDIEAYLIQSEQLPSTLHTAVILDRDGQVLRAAGILAQSFPGSDPDIIDAVRGRLPNLREALATHERSADELIGLALDGEPHRRMLEYGLEFHCPCGTERALAVLATLGPADLEKLASENEQSDVTCNFCGLVSSISATQVRELAAQLRAQQS